MADERPQRIGDYELVELIGDGAQGKVYKARFAEGASRPPDCKSEFVAVKAVRLSGRDMAARERFDRQASLLRRLSHPNIVRYLDSFTWHEGDWDEAHLIVVEYLAGETLADRIAAKSGGLAWSEVKTIFEQCLAGLLYAKEQTVTHRDLKPSNIFLAADGTVKLIDFEVARHEEIAQTDVTTGLKGTFDYMAPDFAHIPNFDGDEQSDIFSFGICLYQALTGLLPFEPLGEGAQIGYLSRWRDGRILEPTFWAGPFRVLHESASFVKQCMHPVRERRFKTFADLQTAFQQIRNRELVHKGAETYELTEHLGHGGAGEVYRAVRRSDGTTVAVKHLYANQQLTRFVREARILQKYPHPALVRYIDFFAVRGLGGENEHFLVLEFLEGMPGSTLQGRTEKGDALPVDEALVLFSHYLSALEFLHGGRRQIVHRDIKPGNLYAPAEHPERGKIFDLGVARVTTGTATAGGVPGTLDYMPPEFFGSGSDRGTPQSDLYAVGLCLYEALAGESALPKLPDDMIETWTQFQRRGEDLRKIDFSGEVFARYPQLKVIIRRAVAPYSRSRYASAEQMRADIEAVLAWTRGEAAAPDIAAVDDFELPSAELQRAPSHVFPWRAAARRRRLIMSAAAVALLLAIVGVGLRIFGVSMPSLTDTVDLLFSAGAGSASVQVQVELAAGFDDGIEIPANGKLQVGKSLRRDSIPLNTERPLRVPAGKWPLNLKVTGFETAQKQISIKAEERQTVQFVLTPLPGTVLLQSVAEDRGAAVYEGDKALGTVGSKIPNLRAGWHELLVRREGHLDRRVRVYVLPGKEVTPPALEPPARDEGTVAIMIQAEYGEYGPAEGTLELGRDGRTVNVRYPFADLSEGLASGTHEISLRVKGYKDPAAKSVSVNFGKSSPVVFKLEPLPCTITLMSEPPEAEVRSASGTLLGKTGEIITLPVPGKHELLVRRPGYEDELVPASIAPGDHREPAAVKLRPKPGRLRVALQPPEAEIQEGGERLGGAREEIVLSAGTHVLTAAAPGYYPASKTVEIPPDGDVQWADTLQARDGALRVTSEPPGAEVWADGELLGTTGEEIGLPAGEKRIQVRKAGYQVWAVRITVPPGGMHKQKAVLEPSPGELTVLCDEDAEIWEGTRHLGSTGTPIKIPPGAHVLEIRKDGYRPVPIRPTIGNGEVVALGPFELVSDVGHLRVVVEIAGAHHRPRRMAPFKGAYRLDAGDWEQFASPLVRRNFSGGHHTIALKLPGYEELAPREFWIEFGQTATVSFAAAPTPARQMELGVLRTFERGEPAPGLPGEADPAFYEKITGLFAAANAVRAGFPVTKVGRRPVLDYFNKIVKLWAVASSFADPFGGELKQVAGDIVDDQLFEHAGLLVRGVGVTRLPPGTQARLRRQFLELLVMAKRKTERTERDLRLEGVVARYFHSEYYHPLIRQEVSGEMPGWEQLIPWVAALFTESRGSGM